MSEPITLFWEATAGQTYSTLVSRHEDLGMGFVANIWIGSRTWCVIVESGRGGECTKSIHGTIGEVYGCGDWPSMARAICAGIITGWVHDAEQERKS